MPHIFHTYYSFPASDHLEIFPLFRISVSTGRSRSDDPVTYHASAIPITPMSNTMPRSQDKKSRTTIVEMIETYMVNFTSPAERSPLLKAPEKGYAVALKTCGSVPARLPMVTFVFPSFDTQLHRHCLSPEPDKNRQRFEDKSHRHPLQEPLPFQTEAAASTGFPPIQTALSQQKSQLKTAAAVPEKVDDHLFYFLICKK